MVGELSDDGKWIWNGSEWKPFVPPEIPAPPTKSSPQQPSFISENEGRANYNWTMVTHRGELIPLITDKQRLYYLVDGEKHILHKPIESGPPHPPPAGLPPASSMKSNVHSWDQISIEDGVTLLKSKVSPYFLFPVLLSLILPPILSASNHDLAREYSVLLGLVSLIALTILLLKVWKLRRDAFEGRMIVAVQGIIFIAKKKTLLKEVMGLATRIFWKVLDQPIIGGLFRMLRPLPKTAHLGLDDMTNRGSLRIPKEDVYNIELESSSIYGTHLVIYLQSRKSLFVKSGIQQTECGISLEAQAEFARWI